MTREHHGSGIVSMARPAKKTTRKSSPGTTKKANRKTATKTGSKAGGAGSSKTVPTVDKFLQRFPPNVRVLADKMRTAIKKSGLPLEESVYLGWQLIAFNLVKGARRKYFCYVAPNHERVELGFQQGTALADVAGVLRGDGVHIRKIVARKPGDIKVRLIGDYVREAAEIALMTRAERTARKLEQEGF